MKLLICADMEGITGVTLWNHVSPEHAEYPRFRRLMTADVNAAIGGAWEAGAKTILVTDGHNRGANLLVEELDPRAQLNSGEGLELSMVEGLQSGVDGVFFIGYHARAGTQNAILDHTWSNACVHDVWLNGRPVGEIGLNAGVCGHYGAPVLLVTGDEAAGIEARDWIPEVDAVVVKQASGRFAARLLAPEVTRERICEAAAGAVLRLRRGDAPAALKVAAPVNLTVAFHTSDQADRAELLPGCERSDARTLVLRGEDMLAAYRAFRAAVALASK